MMRASLFAGLAALLFAATADAQPGRLAGDHAGRHSPHARTPQRFGDEGIGRRAFEIRGVHRPNLSERHGDRGFDRRKEIVIFRGSGHGRFDHHRPIRRGNILHGRDTRLHGRDGRVIFVRPGLDRHGARDFGHRGVARDFGSPGFGAGVNGRGDFGRHRFDNSGHHRGSGRVIMRPRQHQGGRHHHR